MTAIAHHMFAAATGGMRPTSATVTRALLEPVAKAIAAGAVALNSTLKQTDPDAGWQEGYKPGPHQFTFDETIPADAFPRWLRFTANAEKIVLKDYEAPLVGSPVCAVTVHGAPKAAAMAFILAVKDNGHVTATMRDVDMNLLPPQVFTRGHIARASGIFGDWAKINFGALAVAQAQHKVSDVYEMIGKSSIGVASGWDRVFAGRLTA